MAAKGEKKVNKKKFFCLNDSRLPIV